eukprot:TRINITY_DN79690_c0_g1_i1.p1 TRINITY_DN79690_c0_g1~~TRINITY_DN79690_c0_g1_i1.p1  ORF type:complete len:1456 (+),score=235.05 TRINITY_DN79690_c0_g1_i1:597-4370(+)
MAQSKCGGKPCSGPAEETKECLKAGCDKPRDCKISDWGAWSACSKETHGQMIRERVIEQEGKNGGYECSGHLEEIKRCPDYHTKAVDCKFGTWQQWSECTVICGGGVKHRSRSPEPPARVGGMPCEGSMEELTPCNTKPCGHSGQDCIVAPWEEWTHCGSTNQRERFRRIAQEPSSDGKPCTGALSEVAECSTAVDCQFSDWTSWDQCDKTCDGGQRYRHRQITRNPRNGGAECPEDLIQTEGCNREPCADMDYNCKVSAWREWSDCSVTCGPGFQERKRDITHRLSHCGQGCVGNLTMVRACKMDACGDCDPCKWGEWQEWSECDRHCGGGQMHRKRNITRWPSPGCAACEAKDKMVIAACNTMPCPDSELCVDGKWAPWSDWEACSTSCEGGVHWRTRHVKRQATSCGRQPEGESREEGECNVGIPCKASQDCILSAWGSWSACSASCAGVKHRSRKIDQHGYGGGKFCEGALEQTFPCAQGIASTLVNWQSKHLDMDLGHVINNNLGNAGPLYEGDRALRFKAVAADSEQTIDLKITDHNDYEPGQGSEFNGLSNGFGNIYLPRKSESTFTFELVDQTTSDPMVAEDLVLKFYDLDWLGSDLTDYEIIVDGRCEEYFASHDTYFKVTGTCDSPEPTSFKKDEVVHSECNEGGFEYLNLGNVIHSNLGDKGPDWGEQTLIFQHALMVDGRKVDLIIEVQSGSDYEPGDPKANGHWGSALSNNQHGMGVITQLAGGKTKFKARFKESETQKLITVPKINFTFFDIDMPRDDLRERVLVYNMRKHYTTDQNGRPTKGNSVAFQELPRHGGEFSSSRPQVEDPRHPYHLTADQADTAVTIFFEEVQEIEFELEVTWIGRINDDADHAASHNFIFTASACSVPLPEGSRRLQMFLFPWDHPNEKEDKSSDGSAFADQNPASGGGPSPTPAPQAISGPENSIETSDGGVCSKLPGPSQGSSTPHHITPDQERRAVSIRFQTVSKVKVTFKVGKGCGHNFLFAAKACLTGNCDPCGPELSCKFQQWQEWSECSEACGGGEMTRQRSVTQGLKSSHGGGCDGSVSWVKSCNVQACGQHSCTPVDCKWGEWGDWGACSKCGGQRERSRRILQLADCGGATCKAGDAEQIEKCPRRCHDIPYCVWNDWSPFGSCSVTCGCGKKKRTRSLHQVEAPPHEVSKEYEKLDQLKEEVEKMTQSRTTSLALAFFSAPALLITGLAVHRIFVGTRRTADAERHAPREAAVQPLVNGQDVDVSPDDYSPRA